MKSFLSSSSIPRPLSSIPRPLSSVLRPLSSVFRPPFSVLRSLSSVLCPPSSVLHPLPSVFLLLLTLSASAQDDLFITVSAPLADKNFSKQESDVFTTVSSPAAQPVAPSQPVADVKPVVKPLEQPVSPVKKSAEASDPVATAKESVRELEQELLRDPFWPIGFFPEDWQKRKVTQSSSDMDASGWNVAVGKIKISGTSQMGGRTAAIVNGDLKSTGDQIEVMSEGKTYQWQIIGIEADGRVQLKKIGIK